MPDFVWGKDSVPAAPDSGFVWGKDSAPAAPTPSLGESIFEGGGQGASLGWKDEMVAGWKALAKHALPKSLGGTDLPMGEQYKQDLAIQRAQDEAARKANPKAYIASNVAGGIIPTAAATYATGGAYALPMALAQGGAAGAGYSNATTAGGLARDAGVGVGLGALGYGAGQAVGQAGAGLGRWAGAGSRQATSRAAGKAADEVAANIASVRGSLGGEVQKGQRLVENLRRLGTQLSPEEQAAATQLEQRLEQSARNALPSQAGTIATKDAKLAALKSGASQSLKDRTTDLLSTDEMKRQVLARVLRYGPVAVGSFLGHHIGGPLGGSVGALAGAGTRPMVRSIARMGNNPAVQKALYDAVENAAPASGQFLKRAIQAASLGPAQQAALAQ